MQVSKIISSILFSLFSVSTFGHGTSVSPPSRVWNVKESNIENPNFQLAVNAVAIDGTGSYYTWNQCSRNIKAAVQAGLPAGFDYSPWIPNGQIASGGNVTESTGLTFAGLDQVSADWPTTDVNGGEMLSIEFKATAPHDPSVWDIWITTPDWDPANYQMDINIPSSHSGHHVLWIAWHRDDPEGEVFFSASDINIIAAADPCLDSLDLAIIDKTEYHAIQSISCAATIPSPSTVDLKAGSFLLLMPSFQLNPGASMGMYIENCID